MKRNKILLLSSAAVASALCLFSCQREISQDPEEAAKGNPVTFDIAFSLPDACLETKAMGYGTEAGNEKITNVYVAVFSGNHYLNQFAKALPLKKTLNDATIDDISLESDGKTHKYVKDGSGKYNIRVTLAELSGQRYVHVLANVDETRLPDFNAYEDDVMQKVLYTEGIQEGYWTYVSMPSGITSGTVSALADLTLVRNYATVNLTTTDSNLEIKSFDVYNVPDKGMLGAYSGSSSYYTGFSPSKDYLTTVGEYAGWHPDSWTLKTPPANFDGTNDPGKGLKYVFEHPADLDYEARPQDDPANTSAYIIAKIKKTTPASEQYYRIDMIDSDANRVSLLRNFYYAVNIEKIEVSGYDDPVTAAQHPSDVNITMHPITQSATEITNGSAIMRVEYVEKVFTSAGTGTFKYNYLSTKGNADASVKGTLSSPEGSAITDTCPEWSTGGTVIQDSNSSAPDYKWHQVSFTVPDPATAIPLGETQVKSTFKLLAGNGKDKIQRVIKVILMKQQQFSVANPSYNATDSELSFRLEFPAGLSSTLFPLTLVFEDSNQKLSPQMTGFTSTVGNSISDGTTAGQIQFRYDVRYDTYTSSTPYIDVTFKAPSDDLHGKVYVQDTNEYFELKEISY